MRGSRRALAIALAIVSSLFNACARTPARPGRLPAGSASSGMASFYSDALKGRKTASGERYDPEQMTCAHRSLAIGTRVEVVVRKTGASAVCRINDRGPYVNGRIIDLSRAMARRLGIIPAGVVEVDLRVVD
jgi:rare lipoprotein A